MAYTLIETHTVESGGATEIEFTGIAQEAGANLVLVVSGKSTRSDSPRDDIKLQFNGVTSGYSYLYLEGTGSVADSSSASSQAQILITHALSTDFSGLGNLFGSATITISNYASSQNKSVSSEQTAIRNSTDSHSAIQASLSTITSGITSIYLSPENGNFMEHTTASLYLVTTADASGATGSFVTPPKATGGTITSAGGYWIHTFTSSGTFTPTESLTCDYLVIAGGGGGEAGQGGGGGAGGYRTTVGTSGGGGSAETPLSLSATGYTVTVGSGGAANANGSNSVFSTITSTGGGAGGAYSQVGDNGGSGGGAGGQGSNQAGGFATTNQGYAGGASVNPNAGGGGGAGEAGNTDGQRHGGDGVSSSITGTAVIRAAGGSGGSNNGSTVAGGDGGGGSGGGSNADNATAGTANTGSGGGGGGSTPGVGNGAGKAGGSGIVIVRYAA
jgi:hypothetical protein